MTIRTLIALALTAALVGPVLAEEAPPAGDDADPAPTESATSSTSSEAPTDVVETAPPDPRTREAAERLRRAQSLFDRGDFDGALAEFQRVQELLEGHSSQPLVAHNIGRCYERLFRYDRALAEYRRFLEAGAADAESRARVEARLETLEELLATLHLEVDGPSYTVWVDDHDLGADLTTVLVPGGSHVVEIRAPGHVDARREVTAPARSEQTLTFALEPLAEEFRGVHQAIFWTSTGLALASFAAMAVFGGLALAEHEDVSARAADPVQRWFIDDGDLQRIASYSLTADILLGAGALFTVAAAILAFFTDWAGEESRSSSLEAHLLPTVTASSSYVSVSVTGEFR